MKRIATIVMLSVVCLLALGACSSEKVWYEDESCTIKGFAIQKVADGADLYNAKGSIELKGGKTSDGVMATVTLLDKNGNKICEAVGMANDIRPDEKADFLIPLFDGSDFLDKEQIDKIASYQIDGITSSEDLTNAVTKKKAEALELEKKLANR